MIYDVSRIGRSVLPSSLWFRRTRRDAGSTRAEHRQRKSKRNKHACTTATEKRKLEVKHGNLKFRDKSRRRLVSELLPLGCLSILRQEENSLLDQERSQSKETTCCGRQRDTHATLFAKQNTGANKCLIIVLTIEHSCASHNRTVKTIVPLASLP